MNGPECRHQSCSDVVGWAGKAAALSGAGPRQLGEPRPCRPPEGRGERQEGEQAAGKRAWRTCLDAKAESQKLGKKWPHETEESAEESALGPWSHLNSIAETFNLGL